MTSAAAIIFILAFPSAVAQDVGKADVQQLLKAGVSEPSIIKYVVANAPTAKLSADDIVELKTAGASETLLKAMIAASNVILIDLPPPVRVVSETPSSRHFWPTLHAPIDYTVPPAPLRRVVFTYEAWKDARPAYTGYPCSGARFTCEPIPCEPLRSYDGCSGNSYRRSACWRR